MKKIHLVIESNGDWDDHVRIPRKAFLEKETADAFIEEYDLEMSKAARDATTRRIEIDKKVAELVYKPIKKKTLFDTKQDKKRAEEVYALYDEYEELREVANYRSVSVEEIELI